MRLVTTILCMLHLTGFAVTSFAETSPAQNLIDKIAPSIVTINATIKVEMKAGGQSRSTESRLTTEGVVVSPDGLIMISSVPISSDLIKQMMGLSAEDNNDISITPTSFKIIFEHEQKEYTAYLAAKDTVFNLAFLQITDLVDRKLQAVDFNTSVSPNIGDRAACIVRLSKAYDYTPVYQSSSICGIISKPRNAFMLDGSVSGIGLPVFTEKGEIFGVMTLVPTSMKAGDTPRSAFSSMSRFFSMDTDDRMGMFVVPATPISYLITEAKKQAADVIAKHPVVKANTAK